LTGHYFLTFNTNTHFLIEVQLSTFPYTQYPAAKDVVQPVKVELCPLVELDIVGLAEAVIVLPTVGGKFA
jgi:hypothetical protein